MTTKEALVIVAGLSEPSKMPCYGYSIPASKCVTGAKLRKIEGTICAKCYALKGHYVYGPVQDCLNRRLASLQNPLWAEAMATAILGRDSTGYFRWHDSGDIQGVWHLKLICAVAKLTPKVKHWLPTREYGFLAQFLREGGVYPKNLIVRISALKIDGPLPILLAKNLKAVVSGASVANFTCPAPSQENACLTCRACWDKRVPVVIYKKH